MVGAKYNREVLTRTEVARPAGLWSVRGLKGSTQKEFQKSYLGTHGKEYEALAAAVTPQLTKNRVTRHFDSIRDLSIETIERWPVGQTVDLYALIRQLARRVSFKLLFGENDEARVRSFGALLERYHVLNWRVSGHYPQLDVPGCPYHTVLRTAERLAEFIDPWIAEQSCEPRGSNMRAALAAMDTVESGPLTSKRLAGHFSFLGFAAHETMSSALTWTLFLLALHPNVLADLIDEIEAAPPLESIDQQRLGKQALLNGVIWESMRLVPPTPMIPWRTVDSCEIAGLSLPPATRILLSPHLTHRMPEVFVEPTRFLPERWFSINPSPYEYLPFSAGPRRCPGALFGTEFLRVALTAIARRYRLAIRPRAHVDYVYRGITMPKAGIPVTLVRQDRRFTAADIRGSLLDLVMTGAPN
jgi:cytochrome P450